MYHLILLHTKFTYQSLTLSASRFDACEYYHCLKTIAENNSSQITSIQERIKELADEAHSQNLVFRIFIDDYQKHNSVAAREKRNRNWILNALAFSSMESRQTQVADSAEKTFQWITSEKSFTLWLESGHGIYHIVGKPGSGKSTMMKLIERLAKENKFSQLVRSDPRQLIIASFYAWKPQSDAYPWKADDVECIELLVRTLLHQVLAQSPGLPSKVFPQHWKPESFTAIRDMSASQERLELSIQELKDAMKMLQDSEVTESYRFFIIIDGLDEFAKPYGHFRLAAIIQTWFESDSQHVRICVSSRPDNAFPSEFSSSRLQLDQYTRRDVRMLVEQRLKSHENFTSELDSKQQTSLVNLISAKADGVFVWVVLTINELMFRLTDRRNFQDLKELVNRYSSVGLTEFLREIVNRIPESDREDAQAIFSVVQLLSSEGIPWPIAQSFSLIQYTMIPQCCADSRNLDGPTHRSRHTNQEPWEAWRDIETEVRSFQEHLPTISRGLLERSRQSSNDGFPTLVFAHRSVYDLLRSQKEGFWGIDLGLTAQELTIRSFAKTAERHYGHHLDASWRYLIIGILSFVRQDPTEGLLRALRAFDVALFRGQRISPQHSKFEDLDISQASKFFEYVSVFCSALSWNHDWFVRWALQAYPPWIRSCTVKPLVLKACYHGRGELAEVIRVAKRLICLVEADYVSFNEVVCPENLWGLPAPPVGGSPWLNFLLSILFLPFWSNHPWPKTPEGPVEWFDELSDALVKMFSLGAQPIVSFRWWSECSNSFLQAGSAQAAKYAEVGSDEEDPQASLEPDTQFENKIASGEGKGLDFWSSDSKKVELGARFGLVVAIADNPERDSIQGPERAQQGDETFVRLLAWNFRAASGTVTLRDVLEKMFTFERASERQPRIRPSFQRVIQAMETAIVSTESEKQSQGNQLPERESVCAITRLLCTTDYQWYIIAISIGKQSISLV